MRIFEDKERKKAIVLVDQKAIVLFTPVLGEERVWVYVETWEKKDELFARETIMDIVDEAYLMLADGEAEGMDDVPERVRVALAELPEGVW